MIVLGIDPGGSGGLALVGPGHADAIPMPATERDILSAVEEYAASAEFAVIEIVSAFQGQGAGASFKFGASYGGLRMALLASGIAFGGVPPRKWQSAFRLPSQNAAGSKTKKKNAHKARAQELFPSIKVTHALADALLIAEWGRRMRLA